MIVSPCGTYCRASFFEVKKMTINSHFDEITGRYQTNREHSLETAEYAENKAIDSLKSLARIAGLLHDCGKGSKEWQEYFENSISGEGTHRKKDHTTAGGQLAGQLCKNAAAEFIASAVYSHHGLRDMFSADSDSFLMDERLKKASDLPIDESEKNIYSDFGAEELSRLAELASENAEGILRDIHNRFEEWKSSAENYGSERFYLGMFERLLISLLIDADRRSTEDFMSGADLSFPPDECAMQALWERCAENVEKRLAEFKALDGVDRYRREISEICLNASRCDTRRFVLSVPTGAGKTLSSLRFAVNYAKEHKMRRIIYVAPYQSITEQNADEIRQALGMPDIVLEHHSSIIIEDGEELIKYRRDTEDWQSPVVVTTAVQLLNTLFAGKTGNVRRLQSLCGSVVIMDEIQALPVKVTELFDLAVNFLTEFAGTAFVLCTATQPEFGNLDCIKMLPAEDMVKDAEYYSERFRRTEISDNTDVIAGGMSVDEAAEYVFEKAREHGNALFIANTKSCARSVFEKLRTLGGDFELLHLSTNMYPKHRREVIERVKSDAKEGRRMILVSTQIVEAGVNISFRCVIRSLSGIDNIVQAAGRCNRNSEQALGHVYIVKMTAEAENLSRLDDIRIAQQEGAKVLQKLRVNKNVRIDSEKSIAAYFRGYYRAQKAALSYPVTVYGVPTSIVQLLSENENLCNVSGGHLLRQAFKTAGEEFRVIDDDGKYDIVIEADEEVSDMIALLDDARVAMSEKKRVLRHLQQYTVSISEYMKGKILPGIRNCYEGKIFVLEKRYYNYSIGVTDDAAPMESLIL